MARKKTTKGTRKSDINKRRKGTLAVVLPWLRRFGSALGVIALTLWLGVWLYLSGSIGAASQWSEEKFVQASANAGFRVQDILVEGREHASADIILAIINMEKGDPIFAFDPREARAQLEKISWVETAHVQRRLPDTLYIGLEERTPLALYNDGKTLKLLDKNGENIATDKVGQFKSLMIVSGKGAPRNVSELAEFLSEDEDLKNRVKAARRISDRRWDLELKNGITVKLPEDGLGFSLSRLSKAHAESGLLDKDIKAVDMREMDRIAIRTKSGQAQDYSASLKTNVKAGSSI